MPDMTSARRLTVDLYLLVGGGGGDGGGGALVLQYVITVSFAAFAEGEINIVSDVQRHFFCDGLGDLDRADAMTAAELGATHDGAGAAGAGVGVEGGEEVEGGGQGEGGERGEGGEGGEGGVSGSGRMRCSAT